MAALCLTTCCGITVVELPNPGERWHVSEVFAAGALGVLGAAAAVTLVGLWLRPQWRQPVGRTPPKALRIATVLVLVLAAAGLLLWLIGPRTADSTDRAGVGGFLAFGMTWWWGRFFTRGSTPDAVKHRPVRH
ncbi:hypothetical protein [Nakamurella endophytica]|uniref:Transmembrane protein n=1 Tax=Nakamurella endophytica TaxID=1748367 RepID=A0A917T5Q9_9ACTN|nr:hypothetical protein [Nakamurella endophytica]GGM10292.1 hypothetical protein GCM10011594_32750 [Nakamurella endophytica]